MYICMYVCMYVWMDGWMDGWNYVCMRNLHTYVRPCVRVSVGACVRVHVCLSQTQELPLGNKNLEIRTKK